MIEMVQPRIESPEAILLVLLLVGHIVADFLVQSHRTAVEKGERPLVMLRHVFFTFLTQAAFLFAFWSWSLLGWLLLLALGHGIIDFVKSRVDRRRERSLLGFFVDQMLHLAMLLLLAWWLAGRGFLEAPSSQAYLWLPHFAGWALIAAAFIFNNKGGTAVVRLTLRRFPQILPGAGDDGRVEYSMGSLIGSLERFLVLALVLADQWVALGLVLAAKSMVRRDFSDTFKSEYYLIGTLTSILVAVATGLLLRVLL